MKSWIVVLIVVLVLILAFFSWQFIDYKTSFCKDVTPDFEDYDDDGVVTPCPEGCVGGEGGLYCPVDDAEAAAGNLIHVLNDENLWNRLSRAASDNARQYRWAECSRPLMQMFDVIQASR